MSYNNVTNKFGVGKKSASEIKLIKLLSANIELN